MSTSGTSDFEKGFYWFSVKFIQQNFFVILGQINTLFLNSSLAVKGAIQPNAIHVMNLPSFKAKAQDKMSC